ncbi:MAG TPA: hypothetical protein VH157_06995 [Bryobacteraceae bacterium]|jgi:hypothetical protein|nr:hypothetical protein [Bryobacteraceae bacterium]
MKVNHNSNADEARAPREQETREAEARDESWQPASTLPNPHKRPGIVHRWVRTSVNGQPDPANVASAFQEGWVPVIAAEYPELNVQSDHGTRYPDGVEIGGLLLCRMAAEKNQKRTEYYRKMTKDQMVSVNNQLDANRDAKFGSMFRERNPSVVTFGPETRRERNPA